ncbi:MAG: hypothetical protein AB3N11_03555 [Arenibacterium sp.]
MSHRSIMMSLALGVALALPHGAEAFSGKKNTRVNPVDDKVFEVITKNSGRTTDYWCGAADYARRALGADWRATIYIARTRGQSVTTNRRSAVHFTLDPSRAPQAPEGGFFQFGALKEGDNMSVQRANQYCTEPVPRNF